MRENTISAFGEADEFCAALKRAGYQDLLVIGGSAFRARATRIALRHLSLSRIEERQSRIACLSVPDGLIRIVLPPATGTLTCCGVTVPADGIVTQAATGITHERLDGPCVWMDIVVPERDLSKWCRVITGNVPSLPPSTHLWRPSAKALEALIALHAGATRIIEAQAGKAYGSEASHGLEQELISGLVECLECGAPCAAEPGVDYRVHAMAEFARLLVADPCHSPSMTQICAALDVDGRSLRRYCQEHLRMSPTRFIRLRRMQLVHRALRRATSQTVTVSQVVRDHGFTQLGRFAASYRTQYGELPSETLRRGMAP